MVIRSPFSYTFKAFIPASLFEDDLKHSVRPRRFRVGVCRVLLPVGISMLKQAQQLVRARRLVNAQTRNVDCVLPVVSDVQLSGALVDQVNNGLVVDLQVGDSDLA